MATFRYRAADGGEYEFEFDGSDGEAAAYARSQLGEDVLPEGAHPRAYDGSATDTFAKHLNRLKYGITDPIEAGAQIIRQGLPAPVQRVGDALDKGLYDLTGGTFGHPEGDLNQTIQNREARYNRDLKPDEGMDFTRMAGSALTSLLMPAFGQGLAGAALTGAASSMLANPVVDKNIADSDLAFAVDKLGQGAIGAAGGSLVHSILAAALPGMKLSNEAKTLMQNGIEPSVGQAFPPLSKVEQRAQSLPLVGDAIKTMRQAARDQFGKASINEALKPIGGSVDSHGTLGVEKAHGLIDEAYNKARSMVDIFTPDFSKAHDDEVLALLGDTGRLDYNRLISNLTAGRGKLTGQTFKILDSDLGTLARDYGASTGATDKQVGRALAAFQQGLRNQVAEAFPEAGAAFRAADAAHAGMVRIDNAANRAIAHDNAFTPNQLLMATRATDRSARKNASAEGNALLQKWAATGSKALSDTVPNSGTPERLMLAGLAGGAAAVEPSTLLAGAAGWLAYQPAIQREIIKHLQRGVGLHEALILGAQAFVPGLTGELTRE